MKTASNGRITAAQDALRALDSWSVTWVAHLIVGETTYRYSTRALTLDGEVYSPILLSVGRLSRSAPSGVRGLGTIDDTTLHFSNFRSDVNVAFGDLEELHLTYRLEGRIVKVGVLFADDGATEADIIWITSYCVDSLESQTDEARLVCVDAMLARGEQQAGRIIDNAHFPRALASAYGKMAPWIFGTCLDCPAIPIDVGYSSALDGSLADDETTVRVQAISEFPNSGTVTIDDEQIIYTERDTSAHTLGTASSHAQRGKNGTTASHHADGAVVTQTQSTYRLLVADHACKSVTNVRVGGRVLSGTSAASLSDPWGGSRNVQVVELTAPPSYMSVSSYATTIDLRRELDETGEPDETGYAWAAGPNNTGFSKKEIDAVLDHEDSRDGAVIDSNTDRLQVKLTSDLSGGEMGDIVKARARVEYFQRETANPDAPPSRATVFVSSGSTLLAEVSLNPAVAAELDATGSGHTHPAASVSAAHDSSKVVVTVPDTVSQEYPDYCITTTTTRYIVDPANLGGQNWNTYAEMTWLCELGASQYIAARFETWPMAPEKTPSRLRVRIHAANTYVESNVSAHPPGYPSPYSSYIRASLYCGNTLIRKGATVGITGNNFATYATYTLLDIDMATIPTWNHIMEFGLEVRIEKAKVWEAASGDPKPYIATWLRARVLWIETVSSVEASADYVTEHTTSGVVSASTELENLARSSSIAPAQIITFTPNLRAKFAGDLWAAFAGDLRIEIKGTSASVGNEVYVTRVGLELEIKQATRVVDWEGVVADVTGLTDESNNLSDNPVTIAVKTVLSNIDGTPDLGLLGLEESEIDGASFGAAYVHLAGLSGKYPAFVFNRRISQRVSARDLLDSICSNSRSAILREGTQYRWHVRTDTPEEGGAFFFLDEANIISIGVKRGTETQEIINSLTLGFDEDYLAPEASTAYDSHVTSKDLDSIGMPWGLREGDDTLRWLHNQSTNTAARNVADFRIATVGKKWFLVTLETTLETIHLERFDSVIVHLPLHGLYAVPSWIVEARLSGASFGRMEYIVAMPDWTRFCWADGSEASIVISPGNAKMIALLQNAPVWAFSADGDFQHRQFERAVSYEQGVTSGVDPIYHYHDVGFGYRYLMLRDWNDATGQWKNFMVARWRRLSSRLDWQFQVDVLPREGGEIRTGQDLSGETPTDLKTGQTQTNICAEDNTGDRGRVWFMLGGVCVALWDPRGKASSGILSIAGELRPNIF